MKIKISFLCGVFFALISASMHTQAASFDCTKASTKIEKLICGNNELSKLDEALSRIYQQALDRSIQALDPSIDRQQVIKEQREWLKNTRNICGDVECLKDAYKKRIDSINIEQETFLHVQCTSSTGVMLIENILSSDSLPVTPTSEELSSDDRANLLKLGFYSIQRMTERQSCKLGSQTYSFFITYHPSRERGECAAAEFLSLWFETPQGDQFIFTVDGYACMPNQPFLKSLRLVTTSQGNSINVCTSNDPEEPHESSNCSIISISQNR